MTSPVNAAAGSLLVVDDNRVNRLLLGRALEQLGHAVAFAENGREALEALPAAPRGSGPPRHRDARDGRLPDARRLAADPRLRDVPVVMMSSVEEVDSVARCIEMGAEDYLFKPVNPVLLRARVAASLEKKRLRDLQRELFRKFATAEVADESVRPPRAAGPRAGARASRCRRPGTVHHGLVELDLGGL